MTPFFCDIALHRVHALKRDLRFGRHACDNIGLSEVAGKVHNIRQEDFVPYKRVKTITVHNNTAAALHPKSLPQAPTQISIDIAAMSKTSRAWERYGWIWMDMVVSQNRGTPI